MSDISFAEISSDGVSERLWDFGIKADDARLTELEHY